MIKYRSHTWTSQENSLESYQYTLCLFSIPGVFAAVHKFVGFGNIFLSWTRFGCPSVLSLVGFCLLFQLLLNKEYGKDITWNVSGDYNI